MGLAATADHPWHLSAHEVERRLLLATSQFTIILLVVFPLMSLGAERWGRPWAWLYPAAGLGSLWLGDSLAHWAIRAWVGWAS